MDSRIMLVAGYDLFACFVKLVACGGCFEFMHM